MTLKKLLLATAAVAMTATTANALGLTVSAPAAPVTPAAELEFPAVGSTPLTFQLTTSTGNFPAGNNIAVRATLPDGTAFAAPVNGGNITEPGGAAVSAIVQGSTGQIGDTFVDLLISIPQTPSVNALDFGFSIRLESCPTATSSSPLTVTVATETGTDIEEGVVPNASTTAPQLAALNLVRPCLDAVSVAILDDEATTPPGADTVIQLPNYVTLSDSFVGQVNGVINGARARDIAGTPVDDTDIEDVDFVVNIPNVDGIASFDYLGTNFPVNAAGTATGPAAIAVSVAATAQGVSQFFAGGNDISFNVNGDPITTQQISVSGVVVDFLDAVTGGTPAAEAGANANFRATEPQAGGNLDFLQREGQAFGYFDWVGGNPDKTVTVLRATGLSQTGITPFTISFENAVPASLNGQTFKGEYDPAAVTGEKAGSGELTLNSVLGLGLTMPPTFTRADILVNFETNANIDVDRLLFRNGILSDFGDGANATDNLSQTPNFDSDDNNINGVTTE